MMNANISMENWERLSAYLDNQLSPEEISILEKQLAQQPDLRAELMELQQLKLAFKSLPQKKAPRNYTLQLKEKEIKPFYSRFLVPAFSFGSAAAAILLVLSFFFQLNALESTPLEAPQAALMEMEQYPSATQPASREEQPKIIIWGGSPGIGGGGDGLGGAATGMGGGPAALAAEPEQSVESSGLAAEETIPESAPPPTEGEAVAKQLPGLEDSAKSGDQQNLIIGIRPTEQRGQILSTPEAVFTPPLAAEERSRGISRSSLQIALALLASILALSAFILARKSG